MFRVQTLKNPLPGTKTQNDLAIKEVLKLVDENNEEKNEARKRDVKQNSQEAVEIVTYSTDILEKYVTKKVCLGANKVRTYFSSFFFSSFCKSQYTTVGAYNFSVLVSYLLMNKLSKLHQLIRNEIQID